MAHSLSIEDEIVASIRRIMRAVDLHSRRLLEEHGLTGPQLATLHETARLGPVAPGALARALHLSQATVSGILDRLEKRGMIERSRNDRDRRSFIVTVTAAGESALQATPSLLQDRFRSELTRLDEWERTMILAMLQRIATMMDAETISASPVLVTGAVMTEAPEEQPIGETRPRGVEINRDNTAAAEREPSPRENH